MAILWLNGELVRAEDAKVSALDRGLLSGYGLFETLRAYGGKPWAFDEHWSRLLSGGELIGLDVPDGASVRPAIAEVLSANELVDAGVRLTVTGGAGPVDIQSDADSPPSVIVVAWPLRDYSELYEKGAALVTISEGGRPLAGVKTTSYAVSLAGRVLARRSGADDALFLGEGDRVLEATGSNLMIVRDGELTTPPLEEAILPGVTRAFVMEVASRAGLVVKEEPLRLDDLLGADEVVLTSSLREVYPARSVDGRLLAIQGHATRLRGAYEDFVSKRLGAG